MDIRKLGKTFLFVESRRNKRFFSLWPREETVGGDVTRENNINRNGTKRNVVKQRDPEKRNTDERVAMRSIRKKRKGKSPTIETMSCPIAVIAIQRRRRCGRRSSLSSTMSPRPPPFTYIHPSSTYIYIYIFDLSSLLVQRSNESRIVFREILLPPHPGHVESVITVLARAENSRTGWNVSAESRIAGKKKEEDWCERGWEREREWKRGVSPFFSSLRGSPPRYFVPLHPFERNRIPTSRAIHLHRVFFVRS